MKNYAHLQTPVGLLEISESDGVLLGVEFIPFIEKPEGGSMILQEAKWQIQAYFEGKRKDFNLNLHIDAPTFHKEVYSALMNVPYGTTITYNELASLVGKPSASQAVGQAVKHNPFPIIIPCHRVIKSDGSLGEYSGAGGVKTKEWLINHEKGIIL